tara:strand:- start:186 stop:1364 length:1179 start_codon:yes stop_codon:yes gene_type:complete
MNTAYKPEYIAIDELKLNDTNPRHIEDNKFAKLVKSVKNFPAMLEIRPIVIDENNVILGGNMRYKACIKAGLKEVPVVQVDNLTEEQKQEFIIKDNVGFGTWDWEILEEEWDAESLEEWGLDVPFDTDEDKEGLTDEDDVPEVTEEPVSKLGDVWLLGEHRVMCGDSTSADDVAVLMDGEKADMVFTDPPYGISYNPKSSKHETIKNDDVFLDGWIPLVENYSKGFIFMWTGYQVVGKWINITEPFGDITNMIIWSKGGGGLGDLYKRFSTDFEIALVWNRGAELKDKRIGSVWEINKDGGASYVHPTQKPVELIEKALINCSKSKDLVLDLFLGSGSTLIGCEKKGRKCYGMELDPKYVDVVIKRWQEYTGKEATLEGTGETFNLTKPNKT